VISVVVPVYNEERASLLFDELPALQQLGQPWGRSSSTTPTTAPSPR
jgi:hypothetical protein